MNGGWGVPSPIVERTNNPIIDDRFEHILAWSAKVNTHLDALRTLLNTVSNEESTQFVAIRDDINRMLSLLHAQSLEMKRHMETYIKSSCDVISDQVDAVIQWSMNVNTAINRLDQQINAIDRNISSQHVSAVRAVVETSQSLRDQVRSVEAILMNEIRNSGDVTMGMVHEASVASKRYHDDVTISLDLLQTQLIDVVTSRLDAMEQRLRRNAWQDLWSSLWKSIKSMFGGGDGN